MNNWVNNTYCMIKKPKVAKSTVFNKVTEERNFLLRDSIV